MGKEIALVYMAAGLSTRFDRRIKELEKVGVNGETLLEVSLKQALVAGFSKIIFVIGKETEKFVRETFGDLYQGVPIYYAFQSYDSNKRDRPWGTADALCSIRNIIDCPFVVCNGDNIYGEEPFKILVEHLLNNDCEGTVGYRLIDVIPENGKVNRGIFKVDKNNFVIELKEVFGIEKNNLKNTNRNPEDLSNKNLFALYPETIKKLSKRVDIFKDANISDRRVECLLPNELFGLIKSEEIKMKFYMAATPCYDITFVGDEIVVRDKLRNLSFTHHPHQ